MGQQQQQSIAWPVRVDPWLQADIVRLQAITQQMLWGPWGQQQ